MGDDRPSLAYSLNASHAPSNEHNFFSIWDLTNFDKIHMIDAGDD